MRSLLRSLPAFAALALAYLLGACALTQKGSPVAYTTVHAASLSEIEDAAIDVFSKRRFRWVGTSNGVISFERAASRTDEVLYGTWGEDKSIERVELRTASDDPGVYRISLMPFTVRGPGTGMEDVSRRMSVYSREYNAALSELRASLKATR